MDSIHLISRSNCAFVNYVSEVHLHHAIKVSNGTALRIHNPRLKEFVCRIRKKGDDTKTGVGAQRGKGMHHQWVADQAALAKQQGVGEYLDRQGPPPLPQHQSSDQSASAHSVSTSSTTSSFLARNFAKRYFILKVRIFPALWPFNKLLIRLVNSSPIPKTIFTCRSREACGRRRVITRYNTN